MLFALLLRIDFAWYCLLLGCGGHLRYTLRVLLPRPTLSIQAEGTSSQLLSMHAASIVAAFKKLHSVVLPALRT
jgi:hypothetical protein